MTRIDPAATARLGAWLAARGLTDAAVAERVVGDGRANVTTLVSDGEREVVVRRAPAAGGSDILREAAILAAVGRGDVPVPRVLATGEPGEVFDGGFFVMDYLAGPVVTSALPPALEDEAGRRTLAFDLVDTLARLHALDWRGLGVRGRPEGANTRQRERMLRLIADPEGAPPPAFAPLNAWLAAHTPPESGSAVVHSDYRLGNVILHPREPRVRAVLDWELAAVGDPLHDLAYLLATWAWPGEPLTAVRRLGSATLVDGFPSRDELAGRYADATGAALDGLDWYVAAAQFRLAILYEFSRRRGDDPYYQEPGQVERFLAAGAEAAGL